jgi:PII-like signaling protein
LVLPREGKLLRIFVGESDRHEGLALHEWIVRRAREQGLAGATVLRGLEGFGAHSRLHTARILRLSSDLPIIVEIVDTEEKIEAFLPTIDGAIGEGLATIERVEVRFYRAGEPKGE